MKTIKQKIIIICITILISFFVPSTVHAQGSVGDDTQVILGGTYLLESGKSLEGDLLIIGGQGNIQKDATVNGDVFLIGGTLELSGKINGDITSIGGSIYLQDEAYLSGNINTLGGTIKKSDKAVIKGKIIEETKPSLRFSIPFQTWLKQAQPPIASQNSKILLELLQGLFGKVISTIIQSLAMAILAVLVLLFMLKPTERITSSILYQPFLSAGLGLMTLIVAPALVLVLLITIILSPLAIIGALIIFFGTLLGWIAIGLEIGKRISTLFKATWSPPVSAGIGTLILTLVAAGIGWIPCFGWTAPFIISTIGLGAVLLSRFGTKAYSSPGTYTYTQHAPVSHPDGQSKPVETNPFPSPISQLVDPFDPAETPQSMPDSDPSSGVTGKLPQPRKRKSIKKDQQENPENSELG